MTIYKISGTSLLISFVVLGCLFFCYSNSCAQQSVVWGDLEPGLYKAGFMTIEKFDHTRSFQPKYDYNGRLLPGERARPIQVCIWYPAVAADDADAMVFGEYVYPYPEDIEFNTLAANMQARELRFLQGLVSNNRAMVQDIMNVKMTAVDDAPPAEGRFPLIIYHANSMAGYAENAILCEYLAGHGYVVATAHSMGARGWNPEAEGADIEAMTRDKEVVFSVVKGLEFVDADRLGLLGWGFGGLTALIMQMRNQEANAVAVLEGSFMIGDYIDLSEQNPAYNPSNLLTPLLVLYGNKQAGHDPAALDAFRYAETYSMGIDGLSALDFTDYGRLIEMVSPADDSAGRVDRWPTCVDVCNQVKMFFDAFVGKDEEALNRFAGTFSETGAKPEHMRIEYRGGLKPPPAENEFVDIIRSEGGMRGIELYEKFKKQEPDHVMFREAIMNVLGYELLQANRLDDALKVFQLNTLAYPGSANCWDSYAEALMASGDNETAMKCYEKVMEVLPVDSSTDQRMKELIENNARTRLGLTEQPEDSN